MVAPLSLRQPLLIEKGRPRSAAHTGPIVAVVPPENFGSQRMLEKIGLRYDEDARFYNSDAKYNAMTREEYQRDDSTYIQRPAED